MLVFERANHPLGFSTPGNMFAANTPPSRRVRGSTSGPGGAARRKTDATPELPYISPGSNNAYGSKAVNVPKPPRVADTRTSLAAAMKEKEDAMNARLRAEEEERAREAAARQLAGERAGSLVPPSPTQPPSTSRNSREPTVASIRAPSRAPSGMSRTLKSHRQWLTGTTETPEFSALSGIPVDRTYSGEFVVDPVIGTKVGDVNGGVEHAGHDSEPEQSFDPVPASVLPKSPGPSRRFGRSQSASQHVPITSAKGNDGGVPSGVTGGGGGASGTTGGATKQSNSGSKENAERGTARKTGSNDGNGDKRPPRKNAHATIPNSRRRKKRPGHEDAPSRSREGPLDWLMRMYFDIFGRYQVAGIAAIVLWMIISLYFVQYFQALSKGDALFRGPNDNNIYFPPLEQPRDIRELAERVHLFEKNLGTVDRKLATSIREEVSSLKAALASASAPAASAQETASILASLKHQLDNLHRNTERYKMEMARELRRTQEELQRAGKNAAGLLSPSQIREEVITSVKEALPAALAVSLDPDGGIRTTKSFNTAIEELFDKFFPRRFNEELTKATPDTIKAVPSWESFLKDNEKLLRTTIDERIGEMTKNDEGKAVLGKETVMMLIREQLDNYQKDWEKRVLYPLLDQRLDTFKTSIEKEQNQRLKTFESSLEERQKQNLDSVKDSVQRETKDRLASFENLMEKQTDEKIGNAFNKQQSTLLRKAEAAARKAAASANPSRGPASGPYSAAGVQIPDYANILTGGRVWPYLTSPSYEYGVAPPSGIAKIIGLFSGVSQRYASHPATAILPTSDVGDCWAFPGHHGTLAIGLSQPIYPTHVTIEHISKNLAPDYSSAPKKVEFWVRISDPAKRAIVEEAAIKASGEKDGASRIMQLEPPEPGRTQKVDKYVREFVKLGTFDYDIEGDTVQSFELPVDMTNLGAPVDIAAFLVTENYGNDRFTCLYRMKVHGFTPEGLKGSDEDSTEQGSDEKNRQFTS
jgi:hypothetical protein